MTKCSKCKKQMVRRKHAVTETKHLKKPYHFTEWDYCKACGFVQHYEEFKVRN